MIESTRTPSAGGAYCYWLTGIPGAGKTTLANEFARCLHARGIGALVLDGDELRKGLNSDLGYSRADRAENVRRVAEVARCITDAELVALVALVSPWREDRARARDIVGPERFFEVFVDTDIATCVARDPKGMYRLARAGVIPAFTGVSAPYEPPDAPDLKIATATQTVTESVRLLVAHFDSQDCKSGSASGTEASC